MISLDAVRLYKADDSAETVDPGLFLLDRTGLRARLVRRDAGPWPLPGRSANGIEIAFTAGYGPAAGDVPQPIRLAITMLVAQWFESREPVLIGETAGALPTSVASLIAPYREVRL